MKLETMHAQCKEIFLEADTIAITINTWANLEGASIMVNGQGAGLPMRMAGAFRWDEIDAILVALSAARAA